METRDSQFEVPTWLAVLLLAVVGATVLFSILVRGRLAEVVALWLGVFQVAVGLFVVYLFYRFVLAVEKIADKL